MQMKMVLLPAPRRNCLEICIIIQKRVLRTYELIFPNSEFDEVASRMQHKHFTHTTWIITSQNPYRVLKTVHAAFFLHIVCTLFVVLRFFCCTFCFEHLMIFYTFWFLSHFEILFIFAHFLFSAHRNLVNFYNISM